MRKNKGYSLIEMLIVIAIMMILSGLAVATIGLIRKGNAQSAVTEFNSQLSSAYLNTKSLGKKTTSMYFVLKQVTGTKDYVFEMYEEASPTPVLIESTTLKGWDRYVHINYVAPTSTQAYDNVAYPDGTMDYHIKFNKSTGEVERGAGMYEFKYKSGEKFATVYLDAVTGNHYVK